ncbi:zinc protease [Lampropedia hyalina DSM 16112]|jgi:zinc protease|uniref:Zinc protease n=1 Tax=Lampropedia hyalina DSM 16112 TaxID=1122156 RepID=A0A1M4W378_9BURK|nr:pitrilysin family protein [Lampropedia hyalina]SHE75657.1 zinc protease [Lampropedia hyalina DSM 16112]
MTATSLDRSPVRSCAPAPQLPRLGLLLIALTAQAPAWALLPIEHWQQDSGAKVWLVESQALPMVDVRIQFDAGSRRDPAGKAGLAQATASLLTKGTAARQSQRALNEDQLGQAWADLGGQFSASASNDALQFSLRSLTDPALLEPAVQLAARQIGHPAWPAAVWQRDRQRWIASLAEARTRPSTLASEAFAQAVYGSHPYGYQISPQSLQRITVQDMRRFYADAVRACRAHATVVGKVNREEADRIVQQLLANLPATPGSTCPPLADIGPVAALEQASEKTIPVASTQTTIVLGQPGIQRDDPDFFAMLVGNHILGGGGFTSRLMQEVREKRGLVYGVYSDFNPGRHAGAFSISLQTRNDQAPQALQLVREVLTDFVQNGPTEAELQAAKDNLIGGFALRLDSNAKLLGNVSNIAWNGLPLDYLDTWTERVEALGTDDIHRALQKHLNPEHMATVIVGQTAAPQPSTP